MVELEIDLLKIIIHQPKINPHTIKMVYDGIYIARVVLCNLLLFFDCTFINTCIKYDGC